MYRDKQFLIKCTYDYYCQGYEATSDSFLSHGHDFKDACSQLAVWGQDSKIGINFRDFINMTVDGAERLTGE